MSIYQGLKEGDVARVRIRKTHAEDTIVWIRCKLDRLINDGIDRLVFGGQPPNGDSVQRYESRRSKELRRIYTATGEERFVERLRRVYKCA